VQEGCRRRQTSDERSSYGASCEHPWSAASPRGLASTRSREIRGLPASAMYLRRECASARAGEDVHDLVVNLVDSAPCQQAVSDRALKRRTRLVDVHIELPAHQLQASLLKLGDRLEDLSDRQHHVADKRYPGPRSAGAVGRAVPAASADSPPKPRSGGGSERRVWTCGRRPLDHRASRCPRRIGCPPGLHIRMTHRPASRPLDGPHRRWTHGPSHALDGTKRAHHRPAHPATA
jgi:hypothetical protein